MRGVPSEVNLTDYLQLEKRKNCPHPVFNFISQQIFIAITPTISHFKVYKMDFLGKYKFHH